jgi:hypothetical protein
VVAVSAVAGTEEQWQNLEAKWIARCDGIPFHAKDCESDQGDYRGFPHEKNKALYRELVGILSNSELSGIAIAMDLAAQFQVFPDSASLSYYRSFVEVLQRTSEMAENQGQIAKLTFDISTENEFNAGYLYNVMRDGDPRIREWLSPEISFVSAKHSARVQTGDMLAYEGWKALDHTVGPVKRPRKSWDALRSTGRFETYSYSTEWFTDLRKHIESGNLTQMVKFTPEDYQNWLQKAGRQHNLTNMFTFMERMRIRDERDV